MSPSYSLAFSWKFRSWLFLGFFVYLLFFYDLHVPCVLLEVAFFVIFRILKFSPDFLYLLQVPKRSPGSCVLCRFSDSHSFSCFSLSPSSSLAFCWESHSLSFLGFSIFLLFFISFMFLAFSWKLRSWLCLGFFVYLLFFYDLHVPCVLLEVAFFVIFRILKFSPDFLYLLQVPKRSPGSCVLCRFSDSHSFSCFSLSPSSSLAFCWESYSLSFLGFSIFLLFFISFMFLAFSWKLRFLSFLGFSNYLLFFFISIMFLSVLLEVAFFVISRILNLSSVFYLLHVPRVFLEVAFLVISRIFCLSPVFL